MPATASIQLDLRRVPVQKRGRATFDAILDAAARCLQESGVGNLSTNMIADRAGVNIATLYSYFPNKESILRELLLRSDERRLAALQAAAEGLDSDGWKESIREMVEVMASSLVESPYSLELRRAVAATPELRPLSREGDGAAAMVVAERIRVAAPEVEPARARSVAEVAVLGVSGVLDFHCGDGKVDPVLIDDVTEMAASYLAPYLNGR